MKHTQQQQTITTCIAAASSIWCKFLAQVSGSRFFSAQTAHVILTEQFDRWDCLPSIMQLYRQALEGLRVRLNVISCSTKSR